MISNKYLMQLKTYLMTIKLYINFKKHQKNMTNNKQELKDIIENFFIFKNID